MKAKTIVLTVALCLVAAAVCLAADAFTGTWKLNEAKSKLAPGGPKNNDSKGKKFTSTAVYDKQ